ncbi:MAG TPA: ribonuclease III [Bryobacteraceae bacterium]|nr:ribonuclease III [Bryobacteraceae bacterium]
MKAQDISSLEDQIGYRFRDPELLKQALTHSSYAREHAATAPSGEDRPLQDNEQMEFLGDAVLGLVTSQNLYERHPDFREGQLSKLRAHLVSEKHLIRAAKALHLGRYLRLGRGEEKSGGRNKIALQVDALEALLAALYLDSDLDRVREFILKVIVEPEMKRLKRSSANGFPVTDYKSALQETAHSMSRPQPSYVLVSEEGPEHQKTFTIEARLSSHGSHGKLEYVGRGQGPTKKKAEQDAARQAIEYLWSLDQKKVSTKRKKKTS